MPTTLRPATPADIPALLAMMADFTLADGIAWDEPMVAPALLRLLQESSLGFVLLALDGDGGSVGYVVVTFSYDLEFAGRDAFVTELFVRSEHRRCGTARGLLAAAAEHGRGEDVRALHLLVHPGNAAALALYGRVGFRRSPRLMMTLDLALA